MFHKGENFWDFLFFYCFLADQVPLEKGSTLKWKNLLLRRKFFPFREDSFSEGRQRFTFLESVSVPIRVFSVLGISIHLSEMVQILLGKMALYVNCLPSSKIHDAARSSSHTMWITKTQHIGILSRKSSKKESTSETQGCKALASYAYTLRKHVLIYWKFNHQKNEKKWDKKNSDIFHISLKT